MLAAGCRSWLKCIFDVTEAGVISYLLPRTVHNIALMTNSRDSLVVLVDSIASPSSVGLQLAPPTVGSVDELVDGIRVLAFLVVLLYV